MILKEIILNRTVKNAGWLMAGKVFRMVLSFVVGLLTARYLGPSNYGIVNYAATYTTFFTAICTLGINAIIVKDFIDHPGEEGCALGSTILLRIAASMLSFGMVIGIVAIVDMGERLTILVVALYSLGMIFESFDIFRQWFQSKLLSKYYAIATLISYSASSLYKVYLLATGKSVAWFALANSVDYCVVAVMLFVFYRKCNGPHLAFSWRKGKKLLRGGYNYILAGLITAVYASTDRFMLKQMLDEATVGYYSLALTISCMWVFVLSAIIESCSPTIMTYHSTDKSKFVTANKRLYAMIFYAALAASLVICIIAPYFIEIVYGKAYLPAVEPLRIVVWYTAFAYLGVAREAWVVCENRQKYLKYLYLGSAVLNIVLNGMLIPQIGMNGAAIASLVAEISTIFVFPVFMKPLRENVHLMTDAILLKGILPRNKQLEEEK